MNSPVALRPHAPGLPWHQDKPMMALVRRTTCKDCADDEFSEFVHVCRELNLSPLRRQIYCFVFNKSDPDKRNMTLVTAIDGFRSIAARTGNYQPDDQRPEWVFRDDLKDPLTNPLGIESCTVGVYHRPTKDDPFRRVTHTVFWEEYVPLVTRGDADAYEWVSTGEVYPAGHRKAGQDKMRKQLKAGANANIVTRIEPGKTGWIKSGRNQIAKCAEAGVLRKGWPEDFSRIVVEEETDRSAVVDLTADEYAANLTPAEQAAQADADARLARLGGPALFATFDDAGMLERIEIGKFADKVLAHTAKMGPNETALFVDRNRAALQEFWAHNKTDALELKRVLEARSGAAGGTAAAGDSQAKAAPPQQGNATGGAAAPSRGKAIARLTGTLAERHRDNLMNQISQLDSMGDLVAFGRDAEAEIARLPDEMQEGVRAEFNSRQNTVKGMQR